MEKEDAGEDVDVDQVQAWPALSPTRGQVIEVFLARSTFCDPVEHWASFVILKASNWMDGSLALECKHLGCTNNSYDAELDRAFNDAPYFIHLCLSEPCVAPDMDGVDTTQGLHATRVRLWDMSAFVRDQVYVTADCLALADRWLKEAGETRAPHKAKAKPGAPPGPGRRKPAAKGADAAPKPGRGRRAPAEKEPRPPALRKTKEDDKKRQELRRSV